MRRNLEFAPHEAAHSALHVAENIAFGVLRETIDRPVVERAPQIHEFITEELDQCCDTF